MHDAMRHALCDRPGKYAAFFAGMSIARIFLPEDNAGMLIHCYNGLRHVDDVVDGDAPLPGKYSSREEYVLERIACLKSGEQIDYADRSIRMALAHAHRADTTLDREISLILESMLFDAKRAGRNIVYGREAINEQFFRLDIAGTVAGTLKAFGEHPAFQSELEDLGTASRIFYNLRDLDEDLKAGYVNIPAEDIKRLDISFSGDCQGLQRWRMEQVREGQHLLESHRRNDSLCELKPLSRTALILGYWIPADRYFRNS